MSEQLELFDVPNPCRGLCQTNVRGYCLGCFRSREERFAWLNLSNPQKQQVLQRCHLRRSRAQRQASASEILETRQGELF